MLYYGASISDDFDFGGSPQVDSVLSKVDIVSVAKRIANVVKKSLVGRKNIFGVHFPL